MIIDLTKLYNGLVDKVLIDTKHVFTKEDLVNTSIKNIDEVLTTGAVVMNGELFNLELNIKTRLYLEDSITLENVAYDLDIFVSKTLGNSENDEECEEICENRLDILPIIWENIVLEVPLRIVANEKDTVLEGDGWSLNKVDNKTPLSDLKELLDMEE